MITELDTVVLTRSVPALGLTEGDIGAVVHVHANAAYEVEFVTCGGSTVALLTLGEEDLRRLRPNEILDAREMVPSPH